MRLERSTTLAASVARRVCDAADALSDTSALSAELVAEVCAS